MGHADLKFTSLEEYLEDEDKALEKHEYYQGEIRPLHSLRTYNDKQSTLVTHSIIINNIQKQFEKAITKSNKFQVISKVKINNIKWSKPEDLDLVILEKTEDKFDTITNPKVIIEVLSDSTKDYDRGTKFTLFRAIESLEEYILIDSTGDVLIEKFLKNMEGVWQLSEYKSIDDVLKIESINESILLNDIYEGAYNI